MTPQAWIAGVVGIAAVADDLTRRRISNWISGAAFLAGLALQTFEGGWRGAASALLGTAAGGAVFLVFYLAGGMGGGDVKLMAGFGAVLGTKRLLEAALWTAGCGGVMAALVIAASYVRQAWQSKSSRKEEMERRGESSPQRRVEAIPYAPAIACGVWLTLVPKS